jgi:hypothetical protein
MIYCHMIYSPETKQNKVVRYLNVVSRNTITIYIQMVIIHSDYVLCARWVSFVTPDSSSSLPVCSMRMLPPPLLLINCLSCSPSGGPGPPPFPPLGLTPFPSGSRHLPVSSSATFMYAVRVAISQRGKALVEAPKKHSAEFK